MSNPDLNEDIGSLLDNCEPGYHEVTKCVKDKKKVARKTLTPSTVKTNRDARTANIVRCKAQNQVWSAKKGSCVARTGRTDSTKKRDAKAKRAEARIALEASYNCSPGYHYVGGKTNGCVKNTVQKLSLIKL